MSAFTKAAAFQPGTTTETVIRFSTVAGERGSPDNIDTDIGNRIEKGVRAA